MKKYQFLGGPALHSVFSQILLPQIQSFFLHQCGPKTADSLKPLHPYLNWCEAEKRTSKIIKSPKYTNLNLRSPQKKQLIALIEPATREYRLHKLFFLIVFEAQALFLPSKREKRSKFTWCDLFPNFSHIRRWCTGAGLCTNRFEESTSQLQFRLPIFQRILLQMANQRFFPIHL